MNASAPADRAVELIPPCGGALVNLLMPEGERADAMAYASRLPSIQISERAICDLEMLAVGAFSPLDRFMGRRDYQSVLDSMRLANGHLFPIPVTLPVDPGPDIHLGQEIALRDAKNNVLALMVIEEIYPWDPGEMADKVFGSRDPPSDGSGDEPLRPHQHLRASRALQLPPAL